MVVIDLFDGRGVLAFPGARPRESRPWLRSSCSSAVAAAARAPTPSGWPNRCRRPRLFVATCPVIDDEMRRRIEHHRAPARDRGWETVEEQLDLAGVFAPHRHKRAAGRLRHALGQQPHVRGRSRRPAPGRSRHGRPLCAGARCGRRCRGTVISSAMRSAWAWCRKTPQARRYRDLVGRANQIDRRPGRHGDAASACGIPLHLKEERKGST